MASINGKAIVRGLLLGAAIVSLAACTRGSRDLEAWVAEVKARPAPPLDPLPVMKQFETFEYAAQNLRDPFSQPMADQEGGGLRPDPDRRPLSTHTRHHACRCIGNIWVSSSGR